MNNKLVQSCAKLRLNLAGLLRLKKYCQFVRLMLIQTTKMKWHGSLLLKSCAVDNLVASALHTLCDICHTGYRVVRASD